MDPSSLLKSTTTTTTTLAKSRRHSDGTDDAPVAKPGGSLSALLTQKKLVLESQGWLAIRVVSVLDSNAEEPWFKSQPRPCRVTVLGKLFTKQRNW